MPLRPTPTPPPDDRVSSNITPVIYTPGVNDVTMNPADYSLVGEDNTPTGGRKTVGLVLLIGKKGRVHPDVNWITVRVEEKEAPPTSSAPAPAPIQHPFAQNHVDYSFDLNSPYWRKQLVEGAGSGTRVVPGSREMIGSPKEEGPWGQGQSWMFSTRVSVYSGSSWRDVNADWNTTVSHTNDPDGTEPDEPLPATTLLGHNAPHTVRIVAWGGTNSAGVKWRKDETASQGLGTFPFESRPYGSGDYGDVWEPQSFTNALPTLKRTIKNLVIEKVSTSNGTSDYFKFNPTAEDGSGLRNPEVNFTIKDEGDSIGHVYRWRVRVRSTDIEDQTTSVVYEDISSRVGAVVVPINHARLAADSPQASVADWGTYNFDVSIREYASLADAQYDIDRSTFTQLIDSSKIDIVTLRSALLYIPYHMPTPNEERKGHDGKLVDNDDSSADLYISNLLRDMSHVNDATAQAGSVKIELIPPTLGNAIFVENNWSRLLNTPVIDRLYKHFEIGELESQSIYITVISAVDDHAAEYRNHESATMLAKNNRVFSESTRYDLHIWYDGLNSVSLSPAQRTSMEAYISSVFDQITVDFVDDTGMPDSLGPGTRPYSDGIQAYWHNGPTAGKTHGYGFGINAQELSISQQRSQNADYQTVIINEPPSAQAGVMFQGHIAVTRPYGSAWTGTFANGHKDKPILTALLFKTDQIGPMPEPLTQEQKSSSGYRPPIAGGTVPMPFGSISMQVYANVTLHEILHASLGEGSDGSHCVNGSPTCIRNANISSWYNSDMRRLNVITALDDNGDQYRTRSPFDEPAEIYAILDNMYHLHRTQ